mgnify:CR=1 FL=1
MKLTKSQLRKMIEEQMVPAVEPGAEEVTHAGGEPENHGEYSNPGKCGHDFFGILLGYLGGDEDTAREFCEIISSGQIGAMDMAMKEFNISPDADWEIRRAYEKINGSSDRLSTMENRKMKITNKQLQKMILQEINIAVGGFFEEGMEDDVDSDDSSQEPLPADFGSKGDMGQISEDDWEDQDPYDAPPAGGMPRERPPAQEIDQVINDIIVDLEQGTGDMPLSDVIALLQQISHIYLGG